MDGTTMLNRFTPLAVLICLCAACSSAPEKTSVATQQPAHSAFDNTDYKLGAPVQLSMDQDIGLAAGDFANLPGWNEDDHAAAYQAFQRSCNSWQTRADQQDMSQLLPLGKIGDWKQLCKTKVGNGQYRQFFEQHFRPYAVAFQGQFQGLFTGYFLPELHGSIHRSERYSVPIYAKPKEIVHKNGQYGHLVNGQLHPYHSRAEINGGALSGKGLELLWVDNAIDAFFMEIQGSGRVIMDDGRIQNLSFAGKNGHPYSAIGKQLIDSGAIAKEQMSMQAIRAWLVKNPQQAQALMQKNACYVFFRPSDTHATEEAVGSMNVALTPHHSLAVDKSIWPMGIPLWLDAEHPNGQQRIRHLLMAQDTGTAIKGVIRGDVYWGHDESAAEIAGLMQSQGRYFLLVPKNVNVK
jgi:membrane-bound lytic murein transglycosylase A